MENQPCSYGSYVGLYTGAWQGARPAGEGSFAGSWHTGAEKFDMFYSGEWSAGKPNGEGMLMTDRRQILRSDYDNHVSELYVGSMRGGKPHGECYACHEYGNGYGDDGQRFEFFNARFVNGELSGRANYMLYRNDVFYDCGEVEGRNYSLVYSEREKRVQELEAAVYSRIIGFSILPPIC